MITRRNDELQEKIDHACRVEVMAGNMFPLDELRCATAGLPHPQYRFTNRGLKRAREHSKEVAERAARLAGLGAMAARKAFG